MCYTFPFFAEEVMPWKECSVMGERLQFVARGRADGGTLAGNIFIPGPEANELWFTDYKGDFLLAIINTAPSAPS